MKAIVVTGGVLSGLGKGVFSASLASLLQSKNSLVCIKCDGYLNADPGTMNPIEHGEVYVLDDGGEVDMDFGHYERFAHLSAKKSWNITMGKIYKQILQDEREGKFLGKTVQLIPHATDEIKRQIYQIFNQEKAEIALIEIGGTIGDMENELFIESMKQLRTELGCKNIMFFHLTYIPYNSVNCELKSKPTQASVKMLNQAGIYPDAIVCRAEKNITDEIREKISLYCNVKKNEIFSNPNQENIYYLPSYLEDQGILENIENHFGVDESGEHGIKKSEGLGEKDRIFIEMLKKIKTKQFEKKEVLYIAICGKYTNLEDSYASIKEALLHARIHIYTTKKIEIKYELTFIDSEKITTDNTEEFLKDKDGIIIPGGFGSRGLEGKIAIVEYCREKDIPLLGICLGMQVMVIEYARNVCHIKEATSEESFEPSAPAKKNEMHSNTHFVVSLMESQQNISSKGGTMRLGKHKVYLKPNCFLRNIIKKESIDQRFRHRYEVNAKYVDALQEKGLIFSGSTEKNGTGIKLICECPTKTFFIGTQSHPEFTSSPTIPSCFFTSFLEKTWEKKEKYNTQHSTS